MPKRRKIVAVVDDDPSMLNAAESLLDAQGFATMVFASAEEFLDRGAATQVDCLLLDIHLGGVSGIELRRRLKDSRSTLPVIFMTTPRRRGHARAGIQGRLRCLFAQALSGPSIGRRDQQGRALGRTGVGGRTMRVDAPKAWAMPACWLRRWAALEGC
jgi:CheY-like chemotaxis protein